MSVQDPLIRIKLEVDPEATAEETPQSRQKELDERAAEERQRETEKPTEHPKPAEPESLHEREQMRVDATRVKRDALRERMAQKPKPTTRFVRTKRLADLAASRAEPKSRAGVMQKIPLARTAARGVQAIAHTGQAVAGAGRIAGTKSALVASGAVVGKLAWPVALAAAAVAGVRAVTGVAHRASVALGVSEWGGVGGALASGLQATQNWFDRTEAWIRGQVSGITDANELRDQIHLIGGKPDLLPYRSELAELRKSEVQWETWIERQQRTVRDQARVHDVGDWFSRTWGVGAQMRARHGDVGSAERLQ